jgi:hypothetical protein
MKRSKLQPNSSQTTRALKSEAGKRERQGEAETERENRAGGQEGLREAPLTLLKELWAVPFELPGSRTSRHTEVCTN